MGYFLKYRINIKIFISFIFIILVTTVTSLLINYLLFKDSVKKSNIIRLQDSTTAYYNEIKFTEDICLKAVSTLSKDNTLSDLILLKNTDTLGKILGNYYKMGLFDIVEIENPDGTVFIRAHDPDQSGDLKAEQNIVKEGLAGKIAVSYESGKSGIAIRAVAPLEKDGKIIGLLMLGKLFSEELVANMKKLTGLDNGIYWKDKKIISTYDGIQTIYNDKMEKLLENGSVIFDEVIGKDRYYFMIKALYTDDQRYWGAVTLFIKEKDNAGYLSYIKSILFFMVMIGFFLSFLAYLLLANDINNSLSKIIDRINNFNIDDSSQIIDVKANDEFKIIADSINNLSKKIYKYNQQIVKLQDDMIRSAKLAVVGQLSAGLAHEIRNPLSSIKMMSQIIKARYLHNKEGLEEINTVLEEIERIDNLIKDLLEFSKPGPMYFAQHDINKLILNTLNKYRYNIEHQKITVEYNFEKKLPLISVDSEKIQICFINFIVNAIQAMAEGGKLTINTMLQNDKIVIEFKNNGPLISEKDIDKIFEPFFTTKKEGTGLGLALTKLIIERHYGKIFSSSNEKETVFSIILPLVNNNIIPIV